jgi:Fe-S cluster biogenesis protein NfuA
MKMGVEKTLRSYFPNLTEISAVDASSLLSPTLNMLKVVNDALQKILPAVRNLKGEVSVQDVNAEIGEVIVNFSGPKRLKVGVEMVLKDNPLVKIVTFIDA